MKTLKVIRIIGAIVLGGATLYFLFEGDYINAGLQFIMFLLLWGFYRLIYGRLLSKLNKNYKLGYDKDKVLNKANLILHANKFNFFSSEKKYFIVNEYKT